jgi:8-oxo-dGTP diphosphatase
MTSIIVNWGEAIVKLTWTATDVIPEHRLVTSVHGLCFYEGKVMLVDLHNRGWDFPGGHIEDGESSIACLQREAMEEGYVSGECRMLGYITVDHEKNKIWHENMKYPKLGYQLFYRMDIETFHPFLGEHESKKRILIPLHEASSLHHEWNPLFTEILEQAAKRAI